MKAYLLRVLVAWDSFLNVVFLGTPDETISSRAALAWRAGRRWGCVLCRVLDWFQKDHCIDAIAADIARAEYLQQIEQFKADIKAELKAKNI